MRRLHDGDSSQSDPTAVGKMLIHDRSMWTLGAADLIGTDQGPCRSPDIEFVYKNLDPGSSHMASQNLPFSLDNFLCSSNQSRLTSLFLSKLASTV